MRTFDNLSRGNGYRSKNSSMQYLAPRPKSIAALEVYYAERLMHLLSGNGMRGDLQRTIGPKDRPMASRRTCQGHSHKPS
jgi:hypothetical protein